MVDYSVPTATPIIIYASTPLPLFPSLCPPAPTVPLPELHGSTVTQLMEEKHQPPRRPRPPRPTLSAHAECFIPPTRKPLPRERRRYFPPRRPRPATAAEVQARQKQWLSELQAALRARTIAALPPPPLESLRRRPMFGLGTLIRGFNVRGVK